MKMRKRGSRVTELQYCREHSIPNGISFVVIQNNRKIKIVKDWD